MEPGKLRVGGSGLREPKGKGEVSSSRAGRTDKRALASEDVAFGDEMMGGLQAIRRGPML